MSDPPRIVPAAVTPLSEGGEHLLLDWIPQHLAYLEHRGADGRAYAGRADWGRGWPAWSGGAGLLVVRSRAPVSSVSAGRGGRLAGSQQSSRYGGVRS